MKKQSLYISILSLSLVVLFIFEWMKPKPVDWSESYSGYAKKPYGCYILRDLLPDLFPRQPLHYRKLPIAMDKSDSTGSRNMIFINNVFKTDSLETARLLKRAESGDRIFISARVMAGPLADSLNIGIDTQSPFPDTLNLKLPGSKQQKIGFNFVNPTIHRKHPWQFDKNLMTEYHFTSYDTLHATVLGRNGKGNVNYIKIGRGKGAFFIHSVPVAFTNYYMRDSTKATYAFDALSYLPVAPTSWDEYYKAGRIVNTSPLRYIVSQEYLRWAWITALAGLILFFIFRAKRRQRIIPKMVPLRNTTLEFITTVGRLYYQNSDRKNIASKKITYLLEYIRENLLLDTQKLDSNLIDQIAQRSGVDRGQISDLFACINQINRQPEVDKHQFWQLHNQIETFYKRTLR